MIRSKSIPTSSKKTTPSIDTTKLGTIQITLNLTGSVVDKNIKFVPAMVDPTLKGDIVYFPMTVALSKSAIRKAVPNIGDPLFALTRLSDYSKFMYYATDPYRHVPVVLGTDNADAIINGNIKYVVDAFFNKYIQINGRAYRILSRNVDDSKTKYPKKKGEPLVAKITITLDLIDRKKDTMVGRTRQGCIAKRSALNETTVELFGRPMFSRRVEDLERGISDRAPVMYSNVEQGTTMGRVPNRTIKRPATYPYGYTGYYQPPIAAAAAPGKTTPYAPFAYAPAPYPVAYPVPTAPGVLTTPAAPRTKTAASGGTRRKNGRHTHSRTRRTSRRNPRTRSVGIRSKSTRR